MLVASATSETVTEISEALDTSYCETQQLHHTSPSQGLVKAKEQVSPQVAYLGHFRWQGYPTISGSRV